MPETPAAVYGAVNVDPRGKPRIGDWIQTYTGRKFHLLDPCLEDFAIEDIATALANICRFAGHTSQRDRFGRKRPVHYSVAEHSVRVAMLLRRPPPETFRDYRGDVFWGREVAYAGLMHDAAEAYICDMARPFKNLPEFAGYREIEHRLELQLARAFRFVYPLPAAVKFADEILLGTEARDLMHPCIDGWHFRYPHLPARIRPWSPQKARRRFLRCFYAWNTLGVKPPHSWPRRCLHWLTAVE
jgi:hypothetical protein